MEKTLFIEEVSAQEIQSFWQAHYQYLLADGIIQDEEDKEYFQSREYRDVIRAHLCREADRHHLAWFVENGTRIGAVSYCTYQSEDGKCFVLDFWVFPEFRGCGAGHRCFEALMAHTKRDGAGYYEINCDGRPDRLRFWKSNGFAENGMDEYGCPLLIRR